MKRALNHHPPGGNHQPARDLLQIPKNFPILYPLYNTTVFQAPSMDRVFLDRLRAIVEENLGDESFGVEEIARELGMSRASIHRRLKQLTGQSPSQVIREVRLQRAFELLRQNAGTASEVAYRTGFSSPAYFNHCFHQHFGHPPGEVRKTASGQHITEQAPAPATAALPPEAADSLFRARRRLMAQIALTLAMVLALGYTLYAVLIRPPAPAEAGTNPSIAVLPFDYLGADESKNYLADGVLDAITSHLAGIPELRVIARSSVEKYRQSTADARDIGRDLKVGYLLEGSFQLEGEQVRLMARLVDPAGGTTLWSKTYDREWRDIFAVQSEVALAIAEAIKITVSPEAKASMQARSTPDLTAYEYYLKARHYFIYDFLVDNHIFAIQMYEKALEVDPDFAPAWLGLVEAYRSQYWLFMDRSDELVTRIKACLAKAKALVPDSKEYRWHEAIYLHSVAREYPRAARILESILADYPNDDVTLNFLGFTYGTMGEYDKCAEYIEAAIALNPADWDYWNTISIFYQAMRKYDEAMRCNRWLIDNYPSYAGAYQRIVALYRRAGRYHEAEAFIEQHKDHFGGPVGMGLIKAGVAFNKGEVETAIRITEALPDYEHSWGWVYIARFIDLARFYKYAGMDSAATVYFQQSRDFFRLKIEQSERDYRLHAALGVACAGLGLAEEALAAGRRALELENFEIDGWRGFWPEYNMVVILMLLKKYDEALTRLDYIAARSGYITTQNLNSYPMWDPVRNHPKFRTIVNNPAYQARLEGD